MKTCFPNREGCSIKKGAGGWKLASQYIPLKSRSFARKDIKQKSLACDVKWNTSWPENVLRRFM